MKKRRPITPAMKLAVLRQQPRAVFKCPLCEYVLHICHAEFDHHLALVDGGKHTVDNLRAICAPCHREKSAREHIANCKAKRLASGGKKSKRPMAPSRGFDKTRTRKFSGEVVPRG